MTDKFNIGRIKLIGNRDLHFYNKKLIKRVSLIKRADGFHAQFCLDAKRNENVKYTGKSVGIDLGLAHFYTDSDNNKLRSRYADVGLENWKGRSFAIFQCDRCYACPASKT